MGRFPPSGILNGMSVSFGEYDECVDIKSPLNSDDDLEVKGEYCFAKINLPLDKALQTREVHVHVRTHIFGGN